MAKFVVSITNHQSNEEKTIFVFMSTMKISDGLVKSVGIDGEKEKKSKRERKRDKRRKTILLTKSK